MKVWAGKGALQVEVDDGTAALVRRVLDQAAPAVSRALEEAAERVYRAAAQDWPVKTGRSKAELEYGIRIPGPTAIEAFVRNDAKYAKFIVARNLGYRSAVVELLRKPMKRAAAELVEQLGPELRRVIEGG